MKQKIILSIILIFSLVATKAQKTFVGIELGSNIIPIEKTEIGTNFQLGPYTGISVRYDLTENISISSGLYFSQRKKLYFSSDTTSVLDSFDDLFSTLGGGAFELDSLLEDIPLVDLNVYHNTRGIATENYLEIPLMVNFSYKNLSVSAGPYFGFLMNGRKREEIRSTTPLLQAFDIASIDSTGLFELFFPPADETKYDEFTSIAHLKRFDIGAAFGIGYMMDNVKFNLNYTLGFNDYRIDQGTDSKNTHKAIRLSVCYYFGVPGNKDAKPSL